MPSNRELLTKQQKAKAIADELGNFVNKFVYEEGAFIVGVLRQHRTLQQSIGKLFFKMIDQWAHEYKEGRYDARNAALLKRCSEICTLMQQHSENREYWKDLPLI